MDSTNGHSPEIRILDRAEARRRRAEREEGYLFPLRTTGGYARVRIPDVMDKAVVAGLPRELQELVTKKLFTTEDQTVAEMFNVTNTDDAIELLLTMPAKALALANHMVVAGFIEPRVVLTEAELDPNDPKMVTVEDIHSEDRVEFSGLVQAGEREAARLLRTFRSGQLDITPAEPGNQAGAASEPVHGAAPADAGRSRCRRRPGA